MHVFCELVEVSMYVALVFCVEYVVKKACHLCADFLVVVCFAVVEVYGGEVDCGLSVCCWMA